MKSGLELHESRVDLAEVSGTDALVHFSHAYIHKSKGAPGRDRGTGWSQEALLAITNAVATAPLPILPNTIADGFLEVGGIRHTLLPLPFKRRGAVKLSLIFADGTHLEISGVGATVELLGPAIYLEES